MPQKKFRNFKGSSFAVRRIADHLCLENGLSIVANPQPSRGTIYAKQKDGVQQPTGRDRLQELMDESIVIGNSLTEFITKLKRAGVEVKHGQQFSFRPPGSKRFFRQDSLGEDYSAEAILERLSGKRSVAIKKFVALKITRETKFSLLIDIQQKIQEEKGEAYENWARIYNLKQAAHTLIYLQEQGIDSYDDLVKKSSAASGEFNSRLTRIKEIETRQKEIAELQKQIGTYGKTREIYKQWLATGRNENFREQFRADITLHQTAKKYFNNLGMKKLPSINTLKQEWATLEAERKKLFSGYRELKDQRMELVMARDNVERFLGITRDASERIAEHRNNSHER